MRTRSIRGLAPIGALFLSSLFHASVAEEKIAFDLAHDDATVDVRPGESFTVQLLSLLPGTSYKFSVKRRVIPVEPLETPDFARHDIVGGGGEDCSDYDRSIEKIWKAESESKVAPLYLELAALLAHDESSDPCRTQKIAARVLMDSKGRFSLVSNPATLRAGEELEITVSRASGKDGKETKSWTFTVSGGERGSWVVTYGLATFRNRDQEFFSDATATSGEFVIREKADRTDLDATPVVTFSWVSSKNALRDWSHGLSAGVGFDKKAPLAFVGYGVLFNRNVGLMLGAGAMQVRRLDGRFREGDLIKENLDPDQLASETFSPNVFLALTYGFKKNPWGDDKDDKKAKKAKDDD